MRITLAGAMLAISLISGCDDRSAPGAAVPSINAKPVAEAKVEASLSAAQEYLQQDEIAKAEAILRTLIDRAPDESRAHEMLGQLLLTKAMNAERSGDGEASLDLRKQAFASYERAVDLDPKSAGLHHSAGLVAITAGDADAALRHFGQAEKFDPANPQYPLYAAQALMQAERTDEAEAALRRVLAIDADEPHAHASLAMIALQRQDHDGALREMAKARQAMPDDAGFRAQQAKIHRHRNEPRQALELLIGLDEQDRAQEAVAFEIAAAYDALGEPAKAAAAWELCWQANPRGSKAYLAAVRAAEFHLKAGNRPQAVEWGSRAAQAAPGAPQVKALLEEIRRTDEGAD